MARRRGPRGVHTAVVLPPDMLEQLRHSERGVSEEIRRRLNQTFYDDAYDARTRELAADIMEIAAQINREKKFSWHSHEKAHETFAAAVKVLLDAAKPHRSSPVAVASDLLWGDDDPQTLGQVIGRSHLRVKAAIEASEREMRKQRKEDGQ